MRLRVLLWASAIVAWLCPVTAFAAAATDYSDANHWLRAPGGDMPVDVFYLYPTAWRPAPGDGLVCDIDNPSMLAGAPGVYAQTATAFEPFANVYAPLYRQADAAATLGMAPAAAEALLRETPLADATAAFEHYLEHYNHGRPFILAGHSQGSNVLLYLMDTYLKDHPEVRERMIASYIVGYSVTQAYLDANPHLSFGTGEGDTGVILSWNTEAPGVTGNPVALPGAVAINPLTWTRGGEKAGVEYNLGSLDVSDPANSRIVSPGIANAQIDLKRGVLVCDSVNPNEYSLGPPFPLGAFHGSDYPFYYVNIMRNALLRSSVYLSREQAAMYPGAALALADTARAFDRRLPSAFDADAAHGEFRAGLAGAPAAFSSPSALASPGRGDGGITVFASPFGVWSRQDLEGRRYGYDLGGGGIATGGFASFGAFRVGVAAGYAAQRQKMRDFGGRVDADTLHASLFGGARWGSVFLDAAIGYSRAWNDTERHAVFGGLADWNHTAKFGQDVWSGRLSVGYVGEVGCGVRLIPSLGVDVRRIRTGSFAEDGAVTALRMLSSRWTSVELPLALRVDKTFRAGADAAVTPFVSAAWIPELNRDAPSARGSFANVPSAGTFTAEARVPGRSRGRVAAGVRGDWGERLSASVEYSFDFSRSRRRHEVAASFSLGF